MDSRDVAIVRLASLVYAPIALPDAFWRSRFWPGREFDHIFESNSSPLAGGSWKRLFKQTESLTKHPGVTNRKLIWILACRLYELMDVRLDLGDCHGIPIRAIYEPGGIVDEGN